MDQHPLEGVSLIEQWEIADTLGFATFNTLTYGHMAQSTHTLERYYNIMVNGAHATNPNNLAMGTTDFDLAYNNNWIAAYLEEIRKICIFAINNSLLVGQNPLTAYKCSADAELINSKYFGFEYFNKQERFLLIYSAQ